ncbi:DNA ligase D [Rubinisphaera margarita]|uniref:DNA ligase D n=1 Tax=Rubinisphaera margarita TaxID=2909586 RepID=UPI001EE8B439|nr:DNA ligase D [Rubinisphaera margarita]MCG6156687.1 DNA ligase D [Rubinisphaera margarita]
MSQSSAIAMTLEKYRQKRKFDRTPEPEGEQGSRSGASFVVQMHRARRLHYDFRLEIDGTLKSWAVPKGPSLDPSERRLAVHVEDHPLSYADFEGIIPQGNYGAGTVIIWDRGEWEADSDLTADYRKGKLKFRLHGEKLQGGWTLVRMRSKGESADNWLLIKEKDEEARSLDEYDVTTESTESVQSGRTLDEVQAGTKPRTSARKSKRTQKSAPSTPGESVPEKVDPQLATLSPNAPEGDDWFHEIKFDGYRLLAFLNRGGVRLLTRNQNDWTARFPELAESIAKLDAESAVLDGEVVAVDKNGVSSFQQLQNAFRRKATGKLVYQAFDVLFLNGSDLRKNPLEARKKVLADLMTSADAARLQYSDHQIGSGPAFFKECCKLGLEGIISKRRDRPYRSGRGTDWLKTKCLFREEFVIGGFTPPSGSRQGLGALLLGYYSPDGELIYAGRVGTGFSDAVLRDLTKRLTARKIKANPFATKPEGTDRQTTWVRPDVVAQVEFSNWTGDNRLRHPSFQGLREDKPATSIVRQQNGNGPPTEKKTVKKSPTPKSTPAAEMSLFEEQLGELADVRITSPNKILFKDPGITKLDLICYYVDIADWILPHLIDRPLSLVRCPSGASGKCFFQKHAAAGTPDELKRIPIQEKDGVEDYLMVNDLQGLAAVVQMGVLEMHPWGSRADRLEQPDRVIFDLDPDEAVSWPRVVEAALELRTFLEELELTSFVKTTGGKGLHVVVPMTRRQDWDEVKTFSQRVAEEMVSASPDAYTATMSKKARTGKIYIDYQRNGRGATAIAAYSTRARAGAPVATPLTWDELPDIESSQAFTISNIRERLRSLNEDPWAELDTIRQSITKPIRKRLRLS